MTPADVRLKNNRGTQRRTVHVEHCMGTAFTIDVRDPGDWNEAIEDVVSWLWQVDTIFSTYKPNSDISRIRRAELKVVDAHSDVRTVLDLCVRIQGTTGGYFSARAGGLIDPTGLVKGWAIERGSQLLRRHGSTNHAVNGGGDLQLAGEAAPGRPWRVGISDPHDRAQIVGVISGRNLAVATSSTSERGQHITNPHTGTPATALASATIAGPSLTYADAYATAAFAMGPTARSWVERQDGYEALLIGHDAAAVPSTGWSKLAGGPA